MTEEKKNNVVGGTKAGLMEKNGDWAGVENDKVNNDEEKEKTPKISKEQAEDQGRERPLH